MTSSHSESAPIGPYAPVVRAGDLLFCSGQLGLRDGVLVGGGVQSELIQAFSNLESVLASMGATLADVVKTTVFLVDIGNFELMNETYLSCIGDQRPARSVLSVDRLPRAASVEIEAIAFSPRESR
ncbi:MAG TPA: Rid family hydrolase [Acidimicrobiales bacterium]|nr:Rid family hydrolase [Acidimicrobiales bacterium]